MYPTQWWEQGGVVEDLIVLPFDGVPPACYLLIIGVYEEACYLADKAIRLEEVQVVDATGEQVLLQRARVNQELCIGCGICEFQCPVGGEAAIRVYTPADVLSRGATPG
jgi:ferredoxin